MITWPHIGLAGDFTPCEEGVIEAINRNFFLIDAIMQLKVKDFVETIPAEGELGDIYIVESGIYSSTENYLMIWNGVSWQQIIPQAGFIAYVEAEENFFWFNGTDWVLLPKSLGDVLGPNVSLNNSVARFDGTTGKWITDSGVLLDNDNTLTGITNIYTEGIYSDSLNTEVLEVTSIYASDLESEEIYTKLISVDHEINNTDDSDLAAPQAVLVHLTGDLNEITSITAPDRDLNRVHIYENMTGAVVIVKNNASIRTGTDDDLELANGASIFLVYSKASEQWIVVGGSGAGGGGSLRVADIAARNALPDSKRKLGVTVHVLDAGGGESKLYALITATDNTGWREIVTNDSKTVLTNKDIDGGTASNTSRFTVPKGTKAALDALDRKEGTIAYATDKKKAYIDNGDRLTPVGSGETENLISNPRGDDGLDGWTGGSYAAGVKPTGNFTAGGSGLSLSVESGSLSASGENKFVLTKSAANNQGKAQIFDMDIPSGYQASVLSLEVLYKSSTGFTAATQTANSSLIFYAAQSDDGTTFTMLEPTSFNLLSVGTPDTLRGYVQVGPAATKLRLIAYVSESTTQAWTLQFEASFSKTSYAYGTIITDWQRYTPTISWTNCTVGGRWRRVGDTLEVSGIIIPSATLTGTTGLTLSLPQGLTIDRNKISGGGPSYVPVGSASALDLSNSSTGFSFQASLFTAQNYVSILYQDSLTGAQSLVNQTNPITWASGDNIQVKFSVPIQGWSAGAQLADGYDGRVVLFTGRKTVSQSVTGGTTNITFSAFSDNTASWNGTDTYKVPSSGDYRITTSLISDTVSAIIPYVDGVAQQTVAYIPVVNVRGSGSLVLPNLKAGQLITLRSDLTANLAGTTNNSISIEKLSGSAFMSPTATVAATYVGSNGSIVTSGDENNNYLIPLTKIEDTHGMMNTSTGVITIPESGMYSGSLKLGITSSTSADGRAIATIAILDTDGVTVLRNFAGRTSFYTGTNVEIYPQVTMPTIFLKQGMKVRFYLVVPNSVTSANMSVSLAAVNLTITKVK